MFEEKGNHFGCPALDFLTSHGLTDPQISVIISDYPLIVDAKASASPMLQCLSSMSWQKMKGASCIEITEVLSKAKKILGMEGDEKFSDFSDFVRGVTEAIKKKTEYLVKHMNWEPKDVALFPQVLEFSMEEWIVPRCKVIKALMSKGLLGKGSELPPMSSVLACTDQVLLHRYVRKHNDKQLVAELMHIFTAKKRRKKQITLLNEVEEVRVIG